MIAEDSRRYGPLQKRSTGLVGSPSLTAEKRPDLFPNGVWYQVGLYRRLLHRDVCPCFVDVFTASARVHERLCLRPCLPARACKIHCFFAFVFVILRLSWPPSCLRRSSDLRSPSSLGRVDDLGEYRLVLQAAKCFIGVGTRVVGLDRVRGAAGASSFLSDRRGRPAVRGESPAVSDLWKGKGGCAAPRYGWV